MHAVTTKGERRHGQVACAAGDAFVFGAETRGLPAHVLSSVATRIRLPMVTGNRSLNLANAVAVVIYEAWWQVNFGGSV